VSVYLPIFPLPDLTFFPHTLLPLHVFEARYRAMVTDCLARDRRLAVVGLKPGYDAAYEGKPPVHEIAGAGQIVQCERLPSGRFNILVKGDTRVRIEREIPTDTLYRMVRAVPLVETGADRPGVQPLAARAKERCLRVLDAVGRSSTALKEALDSVRSPGALCDQVAAAVIPRTQLRQALLEELDVERRLERLAEALDELVERLSGGR
jgi:Lon protease-like protein